MDLFGKKRIKQLERHLEALMDRNVSRAEDFRKKLEYNFPCGTRIFVIPNHPYELIMGTVVSHTEICASRQVVPLFYPRCDCGCWDWTEVSNGCFCRDCGKLKQSEMTHNPSPWNQTLEDAIKDLPWWKRWNIVHPRHPYTEAAALHLEITLREAWYAFKL